MIPHEEQLKLQAYLDGELSQSESREIAARLARDPQAAALLTELRQTHAALAGFEDGVKLPESREFYWSKIQRQLDASQARVERDSRPTPFLLRLRRLSVPLAGMALVAVAALISVRSGPQENAGVETSLADSGAMIYHDYSAGATFVWLSYPAEKEAADDEEMDPFD